MYGLGHSTLPCIDPSTPTIPSMDSDTPSFPYKAQTCLHFYVWTQTRPHFQIWIQTLLDFHIWAHVFICGSGHTAFPYMDWDTPSQACYKGIAWRWNRGSLQDRGFFFCIFYNLMIWLRVFLVVFLLVVAFFSSGFLIWFWFYFDGFDWWIFLHCLLLF